MKLIQGRYQYASSSDMLGFLGVKTLPIEGMTERLIQGVRVYVKPLPPPTGERQRWRDRPVRNFRGLRVTAICDCGKHVPVGRMHQHKCKER